MKALVVVAAVTVAGCQTKPVAEMSYSELIETSKAIQVRCEAQGAKHPSPEFEICIRQEVSREHATRASNRRAQIAFGEALAEGAGQMSNAYYQAAATPSYAPPRAVTCTTVNAPAGHSSVRCQ